MDGVSNNRFKCYLKIGEILLIGEQLRIAMHKDPSNLIRDRRHLFKQYESCFVGKETVEWLLRSNQASDPETAAYLMNVLLNNSIIHQVCGDGGFKDENILYRFRKDDSTFPWHEDVSILLRAQRMFNKLKNTKNTILAHQECSGKIFKNAFVAQQLIGWMVQEELMKTREDAVKECRRLLENDVIRHVTDNYHFKDNEYIYHFKMDFSHKLELLDLVLPPHDEDEGVAIIPEVGSYNNGSVSGSLSIPGNKVPQRTESGYHSDQGNGTELATSVNSAASPGIMSITTKIKDVQLDKESVLIQRIATPDELECPNTPYERKHVRIMSDPVGFGFVIRGEGPSYVKTVDPESPAAQAGLKVGHYIYSVNDEVALRMNHRDLAHWILAKEYLRLCVLEHR